MGQDEEELKSFPHPLNQDIEEQVPVKKARFDPITQSVKSVWELEKRTTRYVHAPKQKIRCNDGDHVFRCIDIHRYIFACTLCPFKRIVYPTTYAFNEETGKLIHKLTGKTI